MEDVKCTAKMCMLDTYVAAQVAFSSAKTDILVLVGLRFIHSSCSCHHVKTFTCFNMI